MYNFKLTEEIARWAFETICNQSSEWLIAFTNPTAGPWKTIKTPNADGELGEVYRFDLKETRPDIILINDAMKITLIIEAKDSLQKLLSNEQVEKTIDVVNNLFINLGSINNPQYWRDRKNYKVITGLLWGAETTENKKAVNDLFDTHFNELKKYSRLFSGYLLGIETVRTNQSLHCQLRYKEYNNNKSNIIEIENIAKTLNLQII